MVTLFGVLTYVSCGVMDVVVVVNAESNGYQTSKRYEWKLYLKLYININFKWIPETFVKFH